MGQIHRNSTVDERIAALIALMEAEGHPVTVTSKKRTAEEQADLYAKGRTKPGGIVTEKSGKPGDESRHQLDTARDFAFLKNGQANYDESNPWNLLGTKAKEVGLEWGGDWTSLVDRPHVQQPLRAEFKKGSPVGGQTDPASVKITNGGTPATAYRSSPMGGGTATAAPVATPAAKGNILDQLAPAVKANPLDALAPVVSAPVAGRGTKYGRPGAPKDGPGKVSLLSPIPMLSKAGQWVANKVEGVERPITEPGSFNIRGNVLPAEGSPTPTLDMVENAGHLGAGLTGVPSIIEAGQALPDAVRALIAHPKEAIRGGVAGVVEGVGNMTPVDMITTALGIRARLKARAGRVAPTPGSSPSSAAPTAGTPSGPSAARVVKPSGEVVASKPMNPSFRSDSAGVAKGMEQAAEGAPATGLRQYFLDKMEEGARERNKLTQTKFEDGTGNITTDPALPDTQSIRVNRAEGPIQPGNTPGKDLLHRPAGPIPAPARNLNHAAESGSDAVRYSAFREAELRAAAEGESVPAGKRPLGSMKGSKLTPKPRPARPEAALSEDSGIPAGAITTLEELVEAVNDVARKEPEVLAKRDPKLEQLAAEMESTATAPNRAVSTAVVGESVPGSNRRPGAPASPLPAGTQARLRERGVSEAQIAAMTIEEAAPLIAERRVAPADAAMPADAVRRRSTDLNPEAQRERMVELATDPEALRAATAAAAKAKSDGGASRAAAAKAKAESATPHAVEPVRTPEEAAAIAQANAEMKNGNGMPIPRTSKEANAGIKPPPAMPPLREAKPKLTKASGEAVPVNPAAPVAEVPVTKVDAAQTKAAPVAKLDLSNLTPKEQVRITMLEKQIPTSIRKAIQDEVRPNKAIPTAIYDKVKEYEQLIGKTKGKTFAPATERTPVAVPEKAVTAAAAAEGSPPLAKVAAKDPAPPPQTPASPPFREPAPAVKASTKGDHGINYQGKTYTIAEVEAMKEASGSKLPPTLRTAIDNGTDWPTMTREQIGPIMDDVLRYTGWRDTLKTAEPTVARIKEIDAVAESSIAAAAKAEGVPAPKAGSLVARSEAEAAKIAPAKPKPAPIPAKASESAVAEALGETPADRRIRQEVEGRSIDKMLEERRANYDKPKAAKGKPVVRPYITKEDIGIPPTGVDPKVWRTVHANIAEAKRIYKERGYWDPRMIDVARRMFGTDEAARRLGIDKGMVAEISGAPHKQRPASQVMREIDERFNHLMEDPKGFLRMEALLAPVGVAAGGLVGAAIGGESVEDRAAAAISMMVVGGLAGLGAGRVIGRKGTTKTMSGKGKLGTSIEALDTANLLAGPAIVKASLGSVGGVSAMIWQRLREGRTADAKRGMKFMAREAVPLWFKTTTGPMGSRTMAKQGSLTSNVQGRAAKIPQFMLNQVLRPFVAADVVGQMAAKRMGFSEAEGLRMMQNGEPTSWQGQSVLKTVNSAWLFRMLAKFPRVRLGSLERGVEFTPFLSKKFAGGAGTKGARLTGSQGFHTRSAHGAEQLSEKGRRARAEFGLGAIIAGTAYGYFADPGLKAAGIAASTTGPAFLPATAAIAVGKALRNGNNPLTAAAKEVASSVPQVSEADIRMLGQRFIPGRPLRRGLGLED